MTLTANGPGVWANGTAVTFVDGLSVIVTQPSAGVNFAIQILLNNVAVYSTGTCTSVNQAVGRINTSSIASRYITATVTSPYGATILNTLAQAVFAGGVDGSAPTDAQFVTALETFNGALGTGAVASPDNNTGTVEDAMVAHCNTNSRIAIFHTDLATSSAGALSKALSIQGDEHAEHCALSCGLQNMDPK